MLYIIASADDIRAKEVLEDLHTLGAKYTLLDMTGVGSLFEPAPEDTVVAVFSSEGRYKGRYLRIMQDKDVERLGLRKPTWAINLAAHNVALNPQAPTDNEDGRTHAMQELFRVLSGEATSKKLPRKKTTAKREPLRASHGYYFVS